MPPQTIKLPALGPNVKVSFKDEDELDGVAIGPVVVTDLDAYAAWRRANGLDENAIGVPFGSKPDGVHDLGWLSYQDGLNIAKHYGVQLTHY